MTSCRWASQAGHWPQKLDAKAGVLSESICRNSTNGNNWSALALLEGSSYVRSRWQDEQSRPWSVLVLQDRAYLINIHCPGHLGCVPCCVSLLLNKTFWKSTHDTTWLCVPGKGWNDLASRMAKTLGDSEHFRYIKHHELLMFLSNMADQRNLQSLWGHARATTNNFENRTWKSIYTVFCVKKKNAPQGSQTISFLFVEIF